MNTTQLTESLTDIFHSDGHRIVFWYDPDQEFIDAISSISLDGVHTVRCDAESLLELKITLELEDQDGKYLLYFPYPEPEPDKDWLLDIKLYSRVFHADHASILLNDLGLANQSMRSHLALRKKFFNSQERMARLQKFIVPDDQEKELDLKMIAVLVRAEQAGTFDILMKLFAFLCAEECDLKTPPKVWDDIEKFGLAPFFWDQLSITFGYKVSQPSLSDFLIRLLVNDFANTLKGDVPASLHHFLFENRTRVTNASVFAAQWRSHLGHYRQYAQISAKIASELGLDQLLTTFDETNLLDVMTFEAVEQQIIRGLRSKIIQPHQDRPEDLKSAIMRRKDGHWATVQLAGYTTDSNIYATAYAALDAVLDLLALRNVYDAGFSYPSPLAMFHAYTSELYRFDQLYRLFHEAADTVEMAGWDVLKTVQTFVESCYSDWYLDQLSISWGSFMQGEDGLLNHWSLDGVLKQQNFFANHIQPILRTKSKARVFVIISDALRYEVGEELTRTINTQSRFKARLKSQLGVLPSYTALGMAALLPHDSYGYKEGSDQVMIDGQPCATLEQRGAILAKHEGMSIKADTLLAMSKDQGRDHIKPFRAVYIYHDQIDATGDHASTEGETFQAARNTIEKLTSLVKFIINALNGTTILITADHGFIYQDQPPTSLEKSGLEIQPQGSIKKHKRFILGNNLGTSDKTWPGSTRVTAGTSESMEFWLPKGVNRFHFSGGARFIHGGAMPQEVIIPVITIKELDGNALVIDAVKKVGVSLLGSNRKIVNNRQKWIFIQTEKVGDRMLPRTLTISIRDDDALISNETTITFDSDSDTMEDRKRSAKLMLKQGSYDNTKEYALVLRDPETQIEYERIPVNIDLAFMNDF